MREPVLPLGLGPDLSEVELHDPELRGVVEEEIAGVGDLKQTGPPPVPTHSQRDVRLFEARECDDMR